MSETTVGIIGQKYEDRKTGKTGVLVSRDEENRMLVMEAFGGSEFRVSYSAFRSNWRKSRDESVSDVEVDVEVPAGKMSKNEFLTFIGRDASIAAIPPNEDDFEVWLYEQSTPIQVLNVEHGDGGFIIQMLPDIYTFSDFKSHVVKTTFDIKETMSVTCIVNYTDCEEILYAVSEAVRDLNLYGYVSEEE